MAEFKNNKQLTVGEPVQMHFTAIHDIVGTVTAYDSGSEFQTHTFNSAAGSLTMYPEDKKVIADSQKLETVLNNMQANRQRKAESKEAKREHRATKKLSKRIPKEKKSSEENGSFDFSGLAK